MTLQIADSFQYRDKRYDITAADSAYLFNPAAYGFKPRSTTTASHRGYRCIYGILEGRICLKQLDISLFTEEGDDPWKLLKGDPLNGTEPAVDDKNSLFNNIYSDVNLLIDYTGSLTIAADFIQEHYEHMGFAPTWKFDDVHRLTFEKGILKVEENQSEKNRDLREKILRGEEVFPDIRTPKKLTKKSVKQNRKNL